jgi:hypothetical protein
MSIQSDLQAIVDALNSAIADAGKFDGGNSSAGTRVRKAAMEATKGLKALRGSVTDAKNSR